MELLQPNWWDHLQDLTTPQARQWKNEFWAKAGLLRLLAEDEELAPHILPWFYIDPDSVQSGNIHELPESMKIHSWDLLYRSTHPHDGYDFIGGLPTLCDNITVEIPSWEQQERSRLRDRVDEYFVALQLSRRGNQAFVRSDGIGLPSGYRPFIINEILKWIYNWKILRSTLERRYNELNGLLKSTKPDMVQLKHHEMVQRILAKLQKKELVRLSYQKESAWSIKNNRNLCTKYPPLRSYGIYCGTPESTWCIYCILSALWMRYTQSLTLYWPRKWSVTIYRLICWKWLAQGRWWCVPTIYSTSYRTV